MGRIDIIKTELTADMEARGYVGMEDEAAAADMNEVYRTRDLASLTGSQVFNAIDKAEFNGKTDAQKQQIWDILHLGTINPFGIEAAMMIDIFGDSTTITNLQAIRKENISRGVELGVGIVTEGDIVDARV